MNLKVTQQSKTGLNTEFINVDSGRHVSLDHAIEQIRNGNPNYENCMTYTKLLKHFLYNVIMVFVMEIE